MKTIVKQREGRKEYTREDIAEVLASFGQLCEPDIAYDGTEMVVYFLHVDDEGNILGDMDGEEECFICRIPIEDYDITESDIEKYGTDDRGEFAWWDSSFLADHENLSCEAFAEAVDQLTAEVNAYLREIV